MTTIDEAKRRAMQLCSRREYCRQDVYAKIVSWGCTPAEAQQIIDALIKEKFIDERRYTEAYTKDKLRFNKWGRVKIACMLHAQNIDKAVIEEVVAGIDEEEYIHILTSELTKKYQTLHGDNVYDTKAKLFRFATSRGFEPDVINQVINRIINN